MILGDLSSAIMTAPPWKSLLTKFCQWTYNLKSKRLLWLLLPMLISTPSMAQVAKRDSRNNAGQAERVAASPMDYAGSRYLPNNTRDPFLNPLQLRKKSKQYNEEISLEFPPPGIAGTYIADLLFEGTSFRDDNRLAIVRGADKHAYFLREGDRLFDGYLKTIHTDSIILIRETKLRSGKTLTQDVTKRLRNP